MDTQAMDKAIAQMRERRLDALRQQARRDVVMALLDKHGTVNIDDVDAALAEHPGLEPQVLHDQIAAKAAAAVGFAERRLASAQEAATATAGKIVKCEQLLAAAHDARDEANRLVEEARGELADAAALAEYAARRGDAAAGVSGQEHIANAGVASATGKAGA